MCVNTNLNLAIFSAWPKAYASNSSEGTTFATSPRGFFDGDGDNGGSGGGDGGGDGDNGGSGGGGVFTVIVTYEG